MKRIFSAGIIILMILSMLAGCKSANKQNEEEAAQAGDLVFGSAQDDADQNFDSSQEEDDQEEDSDQIGSVIRPSQDNTTQQGGNQQSDDEQQSGNSNQKPGNQQQGNDSSQSDSSNQQQNNQKPSGGSNSGGSNDEDFDGDDFFAAMVADESGTKVRLMSQNVRYNNADDAKDSNKAASTRIHRLQKLVAQNNPDIIATQECDSFWINNLPTYLAGYTMSYQYRNSKKGSNEACAVLWKTTKYKLLDKGSFWLSETPDKSDPAGFGQHYPRVAHWVKLEDKTTGDKLLVFSTHLGFGYTTSQMAYLRGLFANVCAKHTDAYPFIMGDFNFSIDSENFKVLNDGKNMIDLREIAQNMKIDGHCTIGDIRKGTNGAFNNKNGSSIIDFIFAQPRINQAVDYFTILYDRIGVEEKSIPVGPVSDHFAVVADVRINTKISYVEYYSNLS